MDSNEMGQNGNISNEMSLEPSISLNSYTEGLYGEPVKLPRVGDQYQAEIPALMSIPQYRSYTRDPFDKENKGGHSNFVMGLPISIVWVNQEVRPGKDRKADFLHDSKRSRRSEHNVDSVDDLEEKTDEVNGFLVPVLSGDSWTDTEKASFLLGLYIFQKNFFQVKKFVDTKSMEHILFYYYGKFYKTAEQRRWSDCRKGKTRKCVLGEKLFEGLRQQELLSRLFRGLSEELQNDLMQVSKTFNDKKIQLEDYVSWLKTLVGITTLFEAVGIGRGRQDLTGASLPICPEYPLGKPCSSFSAKEIIKILTGDYRLSKARSTDLFWDAVWPILHKKGWNSKEASCYNFAGSSKQSHFFFVPGVPKSSSHRGLVKGEQYFDSVADVLNLVASNPGIIDYGNEADEGEGKTEEEVEVEEEKEKEDEEGGGGGGGNNLPERRRSRRCYLQPRTPCRSMNVMAFTVVDTSLSNRKPYELRNLKDLPVEVSRMFTSISQSQSREDTPSDFAYTLPEEGNGNVKKLTRSRSEDGTNVKRKDVEAGDGSENVRSIERFEERARVNELNGRPSFDLNIPAEEVDFLTEATNPQNSSTEHAELRAGAEPVNTEEQVNRNSRRCGSRNRPPTTRALEAIAHGFMSVNSRKGRDRGVGTSDAANGTNNVSGNGEI